MLVANRLRSAAAVLAVSLALLAPAVAQRSPGIIQGAATDISGNILPGASISLSPGNRATTTDAEGDFQFTAVTPGDYRLTVNYMGLSPSVLTLTVRPGQATAVRAVLKVAPNSQAVTVTASSQAYGEAQAINEERTTSNIVDVLPTALMRSLPNANIADAVGRLPGVTLERDEGEGKYVQIRGTEPRLGNLTIDGVEVPSPEGGIRQVKLDTIPSDLIEAVQVYKTLEADQPGDAIGGSVNMQTKMAGNTPQITIYADGGFTPIIRTAPVGEAGITLGRRFGRSRRLGIVGSFSVDYNGRGIDDVEPLPGLDAANQLTFTNADIREYHYDRKRYGFGVDSDYRLSDESSVWARSLFSDFKDDGHRYDYGLATNAVLDGTSNTNTPILTTERRLGDYQIADIVFGGDHTSGDWSWRWEGSAARSRMANPINGGESLTQFNFINATSNCQYDAAATKTTYDPRFTSACFTEAYNPSNFTLSSIAQANHGLAAQANLQASTSLARSYIAGHHPGVLQFGIWYSNAHKFDDSYENDYTPTGQVLMSQFVDGFHNSNYYGGNYSFGPGVSWEAVNGYLATHPSAFTETSTAGGNPNNFNLIERVAAGYVMNTLTAGRFTLIGGLRMERTQDNTLSFDLQRNCLCFKGRAAYVNLLPSASLEAQLDTNSDIRLAYGRGISRPDPQFLTTATSLDSSTFPPTVTVGNPALKPETANNYDLLYERYLQPVGMVRVGYFYKSLLSPIVNVLSGPSSNVPDCPQPNCYVNTSSNAGSAYIQGVEFGFDQHFNYLPGPLGHLGLFGNYSYTTSRAKGLTGRGDTPAMLRQAPTTWNVSPTFDWRTLSLRAGLAYNGANIYQYNYQTGNPGGIGGPYGDVYLYQHFQVDAQASYGIGHGINLLFTGLNLNNAPFGFFMGSKRFPIQREFYKPTFSFGLRWSSGAE